MKEWWIYMTGRITRATATPPTNPHLNVVAHVVEKSAFDEAVVRAVRCELLIKELLSALKKASDHMIECREKNEIPHGQIIEEIILARVAKLKKRGGV